jgi:acyl-CoA synthetase (AMP-forming)/AMP-acid ligase II
MNEPRWIQDLLVQSASRAPAAPLLVLPQRNVSYEEVALGASAFARTLASLGSPGERVAILADNTAVYASAYFGAAAAGWIAVPLNTTLRAEGLAFMLRDSGAAVLVVEPRFRKVASAALEDAESPVRTVIGEGEFAQPIISIAEAFAGPASVPSSPVSPEAPVAIIYTSGSTGRPRGAVLTHRSLLANTRSIVQYLRLTHEDRVMVVLPFHYVYGKSLLNTHVAVGGSLIVGTDLYFPNEVVKRMEEDRATGLAGVPSTFAVLVHRSRLPGSPPRTLRYVTQAGGAMAPELTRRVIEALPGVEIFVMYGATEASARLTYLEPCELPSRVGSIGKEIPGVRIRIVREGGTEAAPGETGEIVAQGENLMLGYWNDPRETAAVLHPDGLHTGDLAYRDEDGFLYVVGRKKEMIKCGAHRISPKEIEEVLMAHPLVVEAAVIGVPDPVLGEAIRAFVVPKEGTGDPSLVEELLQHAGRRLPEYKVPGRLELRTELPKNAAGKIQKSVLREGSGGSGASA